MLKELFSNNKNIIINTDIDGFLSGMILQKYYGCKIVGFSNSRETIWVTPDVWTWSRHTFLGFSRRWQIFCPCSS